MMAGATPKEITSANESSSRPMAELFWRQRAMRPSSTSKISAASTRAHAKYTCSTSFVSRYDMTENSAPTPQTALPSVNQSARRNSRIIEKRLGGCGVFMEGRRAAGRAVAINKVHYGCAAAPPGAESLRTVSQGGPLPSLTSARLLLRRHTDRLWPRGGRSRVGRCRIRPPPVADPQPPQTPDPPPAPPRSPIRPEPRHAPPPDAPAPHAFLPRCPAAQLAGCRTD